MTRTINGISHPTQNTGCSPARFIPQVDNDSVPPGYRMLRIVRQWIYNRRAARRINLSLPVRFSIVRHVSTNQTRRSRSVSAVTTDLSLSGIALETSVIQVDNFHISMSSDMTSDQLLEIELSLPDRVVLLEGKPLRYERREFGNGGYLVGVKIIGMNEEDRLAYDSYLKQVRR